MKVIDLLNQIEKTCRKNFFSAGIVLLSFALVWLLTGSVLGGLLTGLVSGVLLFRFDSRLLIALSLIFLISCPFLIIIGQGDRAERMAEYAYYVLCLSFLVIILKALMFKIKKAALRRNGLKRIIAWMGSLFERPRYLWGMIGGGLGLLLVVACSVGYFISEKMKGRNIGVASSKELEESLSQEEAKQTKISSLSDISIAVVNAGAGQEKYTKVMEYFSYYGVPFEEEIVTEFDYYNIVVLFKGSARDEAERLLDLLNLSFQAAGFEDDDISSEIVVVVAEDR